MSNSCTQMRRVLVRHNTLNFGSGTVTPSREEWVTEPCGKPLFDARSRAIGKCPSCEGGWTHPHNFPVAVESAS